MRYWNFKISMFYINVRVSHYVLCLQRLSFVKNVLFLSARLSIHMTLGVKNGIWSQILQYYPIFHVVISRFDILIWPSHPTQGALLGFLVHFFCRWCWIVNNEQCCKVNTKKDQNCDIRDDLLRVLAWYEEAIKQLRSTRKSKLK